jgi:hypothetical protein
VKGQPKEELRGPFCSQSRVTNDTNNTGEVWKRAHPCEGLVARMLCRSQASPRGDGLCFSKRHSVGFVAVPSISAWSRHNMAWPWSKRTATGTEKAESNRRIGGPFAILSTDQPPRSDESR